MKRDLKLEDLKERSEIVPMKLLSVRVPVDLIQRIDDVVDLLNAGKGEVVVALLNEGHTGSEAEIREWMSGNICRCGAYPNIVAAIQQVAGQQLDGGKR